MTETQWLGAIGLLICVILAVGLNLIIRHLELINEALTEMLPKKTTLNLSGTRFASNEDIEAMASALKGRL